MNPSGSQQAWICGTSFGPVARHLPPPDLKSRFLPDRATGDVPSGSSPSTTTEAKATFMPCNCLDLQSGQNNGPISQNRRHRQYRVVSFWGYTGYTLCFGILGHYSGHFEGLGIAPGLNIQPVQGHERVHAQTLNNTCRILP